MPDLILLPERGLGDVIEKKQKKAASIFGKVTFPIYCEEDGDRPRPFGSTVAVRICGRFLLLTAAHVLDEILNCSLLTAKPGGDLFPLEGNFYTVAPPAGKTREEDKMDLGFIEVSQNVVRELGDDSFLNAEKINSYEDPSKSKAYSVYGFPKSKVKRPKPHSFRPNVFLYSSTPLLEYEEPLSAQFHLALPYRKKKAVANTTGLGLTAPNAYGVSGAGLWRLFDLSRPEDVNREIPNVYLVGIYTRWDPNAHLAGTRIGYFIEALRSAFPDVKEAIRPIDPDIEMNIRIRRENHISKP